MIEKTEMPASSSHLNMSYLNSFYQTLTNIQVAHGKSIHNRGGFPDHSKKETWNLLVA